MVVSSFLGGISHGIDVMPPLATKTVGSNQRASSTTQLYLKQKECWLIGTFKGHQGQTRYAYYCMVHPKNPAFADEYVGYRDPLNKQSGLKPNEVEDLYTKMYQDGIEYGYQTPIPRNEGDKLLINKLQKDKKMAEDEKSNQQIREERAAEQASKEGLEKAVKEQLSNEQIVQHNNAETEERIAEQPHVVEEDNVLTSPIVID